MYQELTRNYNTIAKEVGIKKIIPVGNAFQLAEETPQWKFARDPDSDYNNPKYPELPKEPNSLNGGFAWRETDGAHKFFKLDGSHANGPHRFVDLLIRLSTAPAGRLGLLTPHLNESIDVRRFIGHEWKFVPIRTYFFYTTGSQYKDNE